MDPYWPDYRKPPVARSPTFRPDPRHQRLNDPGNDAAKMFMRPDEGLNCHQDMQSARSPIVCKRKAVLPAIGASVIITDTNEDNNNVNDSFDGSTHLYVDPPSVVEPDCLSSNNLSLSHSDTANPAQPKETDEASLSTSTADSGFVEKDLENIIELSQDDRDRTTNNPIKPSDKNNSTTCEPSGGTSSVDYNGHPQVPCITMDDDGGPDFDDSEFFPELQRPSTKKKKSRSRLEVGGVDGRTRSRLASRNSVYEDEEPRFGDDSMLKPVSHQSVVAEDKLVSSRCRRSSKLLDKLMLGEYNTGQSTATSFLSPGTNGHPAKSFRSLSNTLSLAGQILRPRTLPQLPPILKKQRTMDIREERQSPTLQQSRDCERPSAPSPSLTPPSPIASERSDCDSSQSEEEPAVDFIDCR